MSSTEILQNLTQDFLMAETLNDFEQLKSEIGQSMRSRMELTVMYVQACVCKRMQQLDDSKQFKVDRWLRKEGGGGVTCILQDGKALWPMFIFLLRVLFYCF